MQAENEKELKKPKKRIFKFQSKILNISLSVALTAMTAALYTALGYLFQPISFLGIQFRVAELIVGMCIIFPWEGLIG
ncbi:MAG: QueT transporter family protein, partial [Promethearchaeota archaeon]